MVGGGNEIMSAEARSPLEGDPSVISWKRLLLPTMSAHTLSVFLVWLPPRIAACVFLPSFHLLALCSSPAWVSPLETRCVFEHMTPGLKLCGLPQLLNPSDNSNKGCLGIWGTCFLLFFHFYVFPLFIWI